MARLLFRAATASSGSMFWMRARTSSVVGVELGAELEEQRLAGLQLLAPVGKPLLVDGRLELGGRVGKRDDADAAAGAGAALLPLRRRSRRPGR